MTTNWIGTKLVLWQYHYDPKAYKDQFGVEHGANVVSEQHHVVVVETKEVPNTYGPGTGTGLRAEDAEGVSYFCHWEQFPDEAMSPYGLWFSGSAPDIKLWYSAQDRVVGLLMLYSNGLRAIPDGWVYCEKHASLFPERCVICGFVLSAQKP